MPTIESFLRGVFFLKKEECRIVKIEEERIEAQAKKEYKAPLTDEERAEIAQDLCDEIDSKEVIGTPEENY